MEDREYELKQAELALKGREVAAREREVAAKEKEGKTSKLFNPLTIAIYVAAIGLFANIYSARKNNEGTEKAEHVRAQSNLLSSVIKTNGNTIDSCSNLIFVVSIKLLDDPDGAIQKVCGTKGGVPTLPATPSFEPEQLTGSRLGTLGPLLSLVVRVEDADSHDPIANAKVVAFGASSMSRFVYTDSSGYAKLDFFNEKSLTVSMDGYEPTTFHPAERMAPWETSLRIDLHRMPKSKH